MESFLKLENLVFDKINFKRIDFKSNSELEFNFSVQIKTNDKESYRVELAVTGNKENEYNFEIILLGFFSIDKNVDPELKEDIINKNTIAIMMPYLRSELSILTAQPGVDCIVLPPFNINQMVDGSKRNNNQ